MEAEAPACKVLVVDDEQAGREGFSRFLEHAGFEAESCGDPTAALRLAGRTRYDGFVVDVLMAGLPIGHELMGTNLWRSSWWTVSLRSCSLGPLSSRASPAPLSRRR